MKKRVEKALEYKAITSQRAVGVAIILICTVISNHEFFTKIKTTEAKIYLSLALLGLVFCVIGGIYTAIAIPAALEPSPKFKKKFTTQTKDFKVLGILQFGSLVTAIYCLLFLIWDTL